MAIDLVPLFAYLLILLYYIRAICVEAYKHSVAKLKFRNAVVSKDIMGVIAYTLLLMHSVLHLPHVGSG